MRSLREIAHFLLPLLYCEFCKKPLLDPKLADKVFGNKAHTPLKKLSLTVHHRNGNHRDNTRGRLLHLFGDLRIVAVSGNTSLTHRKCHCQHEIKLTRKKTKIKPIRERAKDLLKVCFSKKFDSNNLTQHEWNFVASMKGNIGVEAKKYTLYELRRLKKLINKGCRSDRT
jgi:hypothetical protein